MFSLEKAFLLSNDLPREVCLWEMHAKALYELVILCLIHGIYRMLKDKAKETG